MSRQIHEFHVGMSCQGCATAVKNVLNKFQGKGIESVDINLEDQKVLVTSTLTSQEVTDIIKKTGKTVQYILSK